MERRPHEQATARKGARQDLDDIRHAFIGSFKMMVDDLNTTELLPWCIQYEILSPQEVDEVGAKETRRDKNFHLLCAIHRKANVDLGVLAKFREILANINAESGCLEHVIEGLHSQRPTACTVASSTECMNSENVGHWHAVLQTMHTVICSSVDAKHILPELISKEVVTVTQSVEVYNGTTSEQRTALLLNMVRYCGGAKLHGLFEVLWNSNQIPQMLKVADLVKQPTQQYHWRYCEADAFKKAMGRLVVSLKEEDVERLITCLYSDDIIDKSLCDELQSPMPHHSELGRINSVLRHLETLIQQHPRVYEQLIEIFTNRLQLSTPVAILRDCYSSLFLTSDNLSSEERDSGSRYTNTCSPISKFTQQLMELYNTQSSMHTRQKWLYINRNRFYINLAIIKKERVTLATADPVTKETIEGASLDSILQRKEPVEMQDIFRVEPRSRLQVILVQGAPGVGKSTFALEITKKWLVFKEMRCFHVVLLIQLHQPYAHCAKSIKDLLQLYGDDYSQIDSVAEFISKQQGNGLLLILDGFDELPAETTTGRDSLYIRLLAGEYLPKATIILTTRPSVIGSIEQICNERISKNIEILGFLSTDINNFAQEYFKDQEAVQRFLDYIYTHPHIKSMMYIPLNTAIVVELYCSFANPGGQQLPLTLTQLYTELCLYLLQCYATDKKMAMKADPPQEESFLSRLNCMPDFVQKQLKEIAKVAFEGITKQSIVFNDLSPNFVHMNFMNKCETLVRFGRCKKSSFNFLHLTLQEFLAAFHISTLPPEEQLKHLQKYHSEPHFSHIWRFLAGLTSFRGIGWDTFADTMGVSRCGSDMKMCSSLLVNCLYEAQDSHTCSQVYSSGQVVYSPMSVTQYDYYTLGYCISNSPCKWKLCSIGGDGLAMLAAGIKSTAGDPKGTIELIKLSYNGEKIGDLKQLPECMTKALTELNLSNCDLRNSACVHLTKLIPYLPSLERLDLGDNPFFEGGANSLLCALSKLPKLYYLDLLHAKLSVEDLMALSALIHPDRALENLVVGSTTMSLTAKEEMIDVVLRNSNLRSLSIMNLDLAQSGSQLRRKLEENETLHTLMLWDRSFCIEGCVEVVRALETNQTLKSLTLMPWYKFHIPESLFEHESRINWFYYPKQK